MKNALVIFLLLNIMFLFGCDSTVSNNGEIYNQKNKLNESTITNKVAKKEESNLDNKKLIMKKLNIDKDCAEGIVEELEKVGMSTPIIKIKKQNAKTGISAIVVDKKKNKYFIGLGRLGYLEIIRENDNNGSILYAAID